LKLTRQHFHQLRAVLKETLVETGAEEKDVLVFLHVQVEPTHDIKNQYQELRVKYEVAQKNVTSARTKGNDKKIEEAETEAAELEKKFMECREALGAAIDNVVAHRVQAHSDSIAAIQAAVGEIKTEWSKAPEERKVRKSVFHG
jgi:phage shock protein A